LPYYKKVDGEVLLTNAGHYVLSFFGLTVDDLRVMSKEQLKAHVNKFSDVLNDGRITKAGNPRFNDSDEFHSGPNEGYMRKNRSMYSHKPAGQIRTYNDEGSYSRYFSLDQWASKTFPFLIVPKASKSEKNKGCEDLEVKDIGHNRFDKCGKCGGYILQNPSRPSKCKCEQPERQNNIMKGNFHATVKPIKLMSYLITMGSREGDLILDPFCGSGTTLLAAHQLHRKYLGIELNPDYITLAKERLIPMQSQLKMELWADAIRE